VLVVGADAVKVIDGAGCDGDDATTRVELGVEGCPSGVWYVGASGEDSFGCAFGDEQAAVTVVVDENGHHPSVMVERQDAQPAVTGDGGELRLAGGGVPQCGVERVTTDGPAAVDVPLGAQQPEQQRFGASAVAANVRLVGDTPLKVRCAWR